MFDHLDDPLPFRPTAAFRQGAVDRGRRRRLRRRLGATAGAATLALVGVAAAGALYVDRRDDAIDRIDVAGPASVDEATNILLVGTDARPVGDPSGVTGNRSDTMAIVRLRPDGTIGVLSLPRDLVVPATGERLNTAFSADGPQGLVDAVVSFSGVPVDHYVAIDMAGFVDLVDDLGGLDVAVDAPLRDEQSGLDLAPSACTTLDGEQALALVRSRRVDDTGDVGRMARSHAVVTAAVAQLADAGDDPLALDRVARTLGDHAVLDDGLTLGRLVDLARAVAAAGPSGVEATIVPVTADADAGLLRLAPAAAEVFRQFGAVDPPPTTDPTATTTGGQPAVTAEGATVEIRPC